MSESLPIVVDPPLLDDVRRTPVQKAVLGAALVRAQLTMRLKGIGHGQWPSFVGPRPFLSVDGEMSVGDHFAVRAQQLRASIAVEAPARLTIGDDVFVNQGAVIHARTQISIGSRVRIGDLVSVCDTDFHEVDPGGGIRSEPIVIGDDVWIARGAVVLPGSSIGDGAVVAAGSVVRGDVPPWTLVGGVPAKVIRPITSRGRRR
ncbi:acyltransferase [Solicola sp. PLA-1-18]|uniref:acyltransferase n=1 Tax=Solicola sp. PLA-1-18 TaxID=3380532 RepID=UPI003B7DF24D